MKKILLLLFVIALTIGSCKSKKETKGDTTKVELTEKKVEEDLSDVKPKPSDLESKIDENQLFLRIERTVCFGACPTYVAEIYQDGVVIYTGTANVDKIGSFKGKLPKEGVETLKGKIMENEFFELKNSYDSKFVSDIPSTLTYIEFNGNSKKVLCRYECDSRIKKLNLIIEEALNDIKYKPFKK